jgi:hypothetical protein
MEYKIKSRFNRIILGSLVALLLFTGCKPEEEGDDCSPGRNGNLRLVMNMLHHTRPIKGASVFIKFGAVEFPGEDTTLYDYRVTADASTTYAAFDSLSCGQYYIYAVGVDSLLDPVNWVCKGGVPYNTSASAGTDSINVYITEGD